jgi:hypothetical protein
MNEKYSDCVEQISCLLFKALIEREENLIENVSQVDRELFSLLRIIGLKVMSMLLNWLINQVTKKAQETGWVVHRRPKIKYTVIFGSLKIESPYLWNKKLRKGVRPVAETLLISQGDYSVAVKRALTEFGIEESFSGAAQRFQEHYGFEIERNSLNREVKTIANLAEQYIEYRLENRKTEKLESKGFPRLVVELDGCQIRTGLNHPAEKEELTLKRKLKKKKRKIDWREVRVGFARQVNDKEERTFIARMDKYPVLVEQLVNAAIDQGMGQKTEVTAVADGGT